MRSKQQLTVSFHGGKRLAIPEPFRHGVRMLRCSTLAVVFTLGVIAGIAQAAPSVERLAELFLPPENETPLISPTASHAAFLVRRGDVYAVATYSFADGKVANVATKGVFPTQLWWKSADQLLVRTTDAEGTARGFTLLPSEAVRPRTCGSSAR